MTIAPRKVDMWIISDDNSRVVEIVYIPQG